MDRARAMLDALMGPGRDVVEKDEGKTKEKFKDPTVCKPFLVGLCPLGPGMLGGKRGLDLCDKIHSEVMRGQFESHKDKKELEWEYNLECLKTLEYAIRECDSRILKEKARIRDDWGNRRPPLPVHVIDQVSRMKRESSAMFAMAEQLDDDKFKEKEALIVRSGEIMKEAEALEEKETKRAIAAAVTEEVCEVCGTCYQGEAGDAAHKKFKVHGVYSEIRAKFEELHPNKDEWEKKLKEAAGADSKKSRMEEFKKSSRKDSDKDEDRKSRKREESRARSSDKRKKEDRGRDRRRNDSRDRSRSRRKREDRGSDRRRDKSRGRSRRDDSRSRRRR